jgi:DNA-binding transcriptional LysR family regulator
LEQAFAKERLQRRVRLKVSSYHVALQVVRSTGLLATVPRRFVTPDVHALELPLPMPAADVRQFWHLRAHHDPAHAWFRSVVADLFTAVQAASGASGGSGQAA